MRVLALLCLLATPALALSPGEVEPKPQVVDHAALTERALTVLKAQFGAFQSDAAALAEAGRAVCETGTAPETLRAPLAATWQSWAALDGYQFGPIEQQSAALKINFWPDKKGFVGRGLAQFQALPEAQQRDPEVIARSSAAAQGLPAIALLLEAEAPCPALQSITAHVARMSAALHDGWFAPEGWAALVRTPGPENAAYRDAREVTQTLFTALQFGLERASDMRLGRPLDRFDRPLPRRAEARRVGLSLALVRAQLDGVARMVTDGFDGALSESSAAALAHFHLEAQAALEAIDTPLETALASPGGWLKVDIARERIQRYREEIARLAGPELGVARGFSAGDGD